jgi:cation diffusion facilitator family transporter
MDAADAEPFRHGHSFSADKRHVESLTLAVVIITLLTMVTEIAFGLLTNSMALFADGLHMGTHAFALAITFGAYRLARKHSGDSKYSFGTWKMEVLGAYSSALVLGIVAIGMAWASAERLLEPLAIHYDQALIVAAIGLAVNLVCAFILGRGSHHEHGHGHVGHDDLNLRAAYVHVIADALTSVLAIGALLGAKYYGLDWLDPVMGLVGAALIMKWSAYLLRDSAHILLDRGAGGALSDGIRAAIESDGDATVCDLHLWKVGEDSYACIISLVAERGRPVDEYRARVSTFPELAHITIEMNERCGLKRREPGS